MGHLCKCLWQSVRLGKRPTCVLFARQFEGPLWPPWTMESMPTGVRRGHHLQLFQETFVRRLPLTRPSFPATTGRPRRHHVCWHPDWKRPSHLEASRLRQRAKDVYRNSSAFCLKYSVLAENFQPTTSMKYLLVNRACLIDGILEVCHDKQSLRHLNTERKLGKNRR